MERKVRRRMPEGIQSFREIREQGYLYVDKTDLVWELAHDSKFSYLSRPRRFGKSLLIDTLACYFEGRKELFEGLKIMQLEEEWVKHPVVRLDMSNGGATPDELKSYLNKAFAQYEGQYGITPLPGSSLTVRFADIIQTAYNQTGQRVAVLIDEYDSPLQHSWKTEWHEDCTAIYRSVFAVLKTYTICEQLVFITGITKFTQISIFSVLNNLTNISFLPEYAALCGITKDEVAESFMPEIERMGTMNGWTTEETLEKLKENYDGYHFSKGNMVDVYNPYSMVIALAKGEIGNYWATSGATSLIPKFVDNMELHIQDYEDCVASRIQLESSDVSTGSPELFLYQSGYLTIKGFDPTTYFLGIPNQEVRQALYDVVVPALSMRKQGEVRSEQDRLQYYLNYIRLPEAMKTLKALIADVPYSNKKLQSMDMEERYRFIISCVFNALGIRIEVERMMSKGRIDMVAWTLHAIYVIELKLTKNGGLAAAERQILANDYAAPFKADDREVVPLAIELDDEGRGLREWKRIK